jgi:hypothetical protein
MKKLLWMLVAVAVLTVGGYTAKAALSNDRIDCPGKITCPLTGEQICSDQCPLNK